MINRATWRRHKRATKKPPTVVCVFICTLAFLVSLFLLFSPPSLCGKCRVLVRARGCLLVLVLVSASCVAAPSAAVSLGSARWDAKDDGSAPPRQPRTRPPKRPTGRDDTDETDTRRPPPPPGEDTRARGDIRHDTHDTTIDTTREAYTNGTGPHRLRVSRAPRVRRWSARAPCLRVSAAGRPL